MKIKKCNLSDIEEICSIVVQANKPIAKTYGITTYNGSSHPSNCKVNWIKDNMSNGILYFFCYNNDKALGTIGYKIKGKVLTIKHLAVLPESWGIGIGTILLEHILKFGKEKNIDSINLGLIDDNFRLKTWYQSFGFKPCKSKQIQGLPYKITFMKMIL